MLVDVAVPVETGNDESTQTNGATMDETKIHDDDE
jgi:hypothetical protein